MRKSFMIGLLAAFTALFGTAALACGACQGGGKSCGCQAQASAKSCGCQGGSCSAAPLPKGGL